MRTSCLNGFKAVLLASGACASVFAVPAFAQSTDAEEEATQGTIVVTGSRIARPDYVSNSPTVTVDEEFLRQSSTSAIEQQLNKLPQFVVSQSSTAKNNDETGLIAAGGDIQPNATNTPGAATVSLRGVGANRTLVLIDGRRGTPGNASGAVDISTIPSSALARVEIISGGASATYGADAVAGVTNFILKKDFQGAEIDVQAGITEGGDGFEYQVSGILGADIGGGRGNVSIAGSVNTRENLFQKDLPFYRDLWANPDTTSGAFFFVPRPGISGLQFPADCGDNCVVSDLFPGANPAVPNNLGSVYLNQDGSLFTAGSAFGGSNFNAVGAHALLKEWATNDAGSGTQWKTTSVGTTYGINTLTPATVPTTRYNFLARGNYEINDWVGVFGQGMFNNSSTYTVQEAGGAQFGWDIMIPWGDAAYTGQVNGLLNNYQNPAVPSAVLADGVTPNPAFLNRYRGILDCATAGLVCSNTDVFQAVVPESIQTLLNASGAQSFSLAGFLPNPRATYSDVTTYTLIAGLEGSIPGTDMTWEAFVNHGQSRTLSRQTGMYSMSRLRAVFSAPNFGQGMSYQSNQFAGIGGISPGFGAASATCTSGLNFFGGYDGITDDCRQAISSDVYNRATSRQTIVEANIQGGLFELPAGQVRFAAGASYRENRFEFLNDANTTAGSSFLDSIVGIYPSTNMEMSGIDAKELYGELLIPVLSDLPGIQELSLEVGGRMSDYSTTGTSYTFKALADWQVTDWLRFRGGFNRAERAPNIAELLLTPQQAFRSDAVGDVCSTRHNNPSSANIANNPTGALSVQAICLEMMARDNGGIYVDITNPNSFYFAADADTRQGTGGGSGFGYAVGNQYYRDNINSSAEPLRPEVADTWTLGAVIQSPVRSGLLSRVNLTIDYFNISIKDPISSIGAGGILLRCIDPAYNPAAAGVAAGATSAAGLNTPEIRARAQAALQGGTCATAFRDSSAGFGATGGLASSRMYGTYGNEGSIKLSGLDANLSLSADAGPGTVFLNINANYMFNFDIQTQNGQPSLDYVGTTGTGALGVNSGSSFEYRLLTNLGYTWGPANLSLQWQHIPATDDAGDVFYLNGRTDAPNNFTGLPAYNLFNLNGSFSATQNLTFRLGIDNLFNKRPPLTGINTAANASLGQLPGGGYSLFHDVLGRRFSFGANVKF